MLNLGDIEDDVVVEKIFTESWSIGSLIGAAAILGLESHQLSDNWFPAIRVIRHPILVADAWAIAWLWSFLDLASQSLEITKAEINSDLFGFQRPGDNTAVFTIGHRLSMTYIDLHDRETEFELYIAPWSHGEVMLRIETQLTPKIEEINHYIQQINTGDLLGILLSTAINIGKAIRERWKLYIGYSHTAPIDDGSLPIEGHLVKGPIAPTFVIANTQYIGDLRFHKATVYGDELHPVMEWAAYINDIWTVRVTYYDKEIAIEHVCANKYIPPTNILLTKGHMLRLNNVDIYFNALPTFLDLHQAAYYAITKRANGLSSPFTELSTIEAIRSIVRNSLIRSHIPRKVFNLL